MSGRGQQSGLRPRPQERLELRTVSVRVLLVLQLLLVQPAPWLPALLPQPAEPVRAALLLQVELRQ
ncbi:hypothetical protein PS710_00392 [Pseudomonas fluorescens]|uniref:Uncharacterized protein n=1 Tax=Pseudomonas fluorescens TaxID=294 RepID=A0A5E7A438_PSEFL|nr:hypothetical protein PS710_00392 [Pseudomonas fluorescens]